MAALLVGMAVMAIFMSAALPVWSTATKRAREEELVFRGEQYARAIALYQRKYANALPPSIDVLINERFLRRKYSDPVTNGEFQALTGSLGQGTPGGGADPGGARGATGATGTAQQGAQGRGGQSAPQGLGRQGGGLAAQQGGFAGAGGPFAAGGIIGVASKSTDKSLRLYNGRGAYNEWTFVAQQRQLQAGGPGGAAGQTGDGRGARGGQPAGAGGVGGGRGGPGADPGANRPPQSPFSGGRGFRPDGTQGR
jgi:type II secretory pathway pseudopilin PulG